jgi:hypothetical protein
MTLQLALWLSLLALLVVLSLYESLHDSLPDGVLSVACIGYTVVTLLAATTADQLVTSFAAGSVGLALGLLSEAVRRHFFDSRAGLCTGLVVGWPGILVVGVGWGLLASVVVCYLVLTDRTRELLTVSFLPFLTLSVIVVFALGATIYR